MKQTLLLLAGLMITGIGFSQQTKLYATNGVAIKGYDPVAYFTMQKAVKGTDTYSYDWEGSTWKFSAKANLDSFTVNPRKYIPQYGGFCAYGCSENHLSPTDPEAWTIIDNKLYFNYNMKTRVAWLKDTASRIKNADQFWPVLNH